MTRAGSVPPLVVDYACDTRHPEGREGHPEPEQAAPPPNSHAPRYRRGDGGAGGGGLIGVPFSTCSRRVG